METTYATETVPASQLQAGDVIEVQSPRAGKTEWIALSHVGRNDLISVTGAVAKPNAFGNLRTKRGARKAFWSFPVTRPVKRILP